MILKKVMELSPEDVEVLLGNVLRDFADRYKNFRLLFQKHYGLTKYLISEDDQTLLSENTKCLIGAYFTMEYSIEAAALFNPSIVKDPDQQRAEEGAMNCIMSFRATGESPHRINFLLHCLAISIASRAPL